MMRLHRWLLDEYKRDGSFSWGKSIVGYATLVLAIIIISGIVIWYPRNKKVLRNRLKVKTKAGWFRFFYDLHVSGGFYAALLLLILALTGLTWSFGWYRKKRRITHNGLRCYRHWKAIIRTLTQSRSKMAPLRFLRPVMGIQEEATVTPLILLRVRLRKSNYIKISQNRGR